MAKKYNHCYNFSKWKVGFPKGQTMVNILLQYVHVTATIAHACREWYSRKYVWITAQFDYFIFAELHGNLV